MNATLSPETQTLLNQAQMALQAGDHAGLIELGRSLGFALPQHGIGPYLVGLAHTNLGRLPEAETALQHAVRLEPQHADYLFQLAYVEMYLGKIDAALDGFYRVIALQPRKDAAYVNVGAVFARRTDYAKALDWFRRALAINAGNFAAWNSIAEVTLAQGDFDAALHAARQAQAIDPRHAGIAHLLGTAYELMGRGDDAIAAFVRAHECDPANVRAAARLAAMYAQRGEYDAARQWADRARAAAPHNPDALLAEAIAYRRTLPKLPAEVVAGIFNTWANAYDKHLLNALKTQTPALTMEAAKTWIDVGDRAERSLDVLDLGCGTGLFGERIAPYARTLTGVDLAEGMLAEARKRSCYTELRQADLLAALQIAAGSSVDLVAATDVFVYLGDLCEVFSEVARVLRPGGAFVFTVETSDAAEDGEAEYVLVPPGRYRHAAGYVRTLATRANLDIAEWREADLRYEGGMPVAGGVARLQKSA